jgi:hypothetical protein
MAQEEGPADGGDQAEIHRALQPSRAAFAAMWAARRVFPCPSGPYSQRAVRSTPASHPSTADFRCTLYSTHWAISRARSERYSKTEGK